MLFLAELYEPAESLRRVRHNFQWTELGDGSLVRIFTRSVLGRGPKVEAKAEAEAKCYEAEAECYEARVV